MSCRHLSIAIAAAALLTVAALAVAEEPPASGPTTRVDLPDGPIRVRVVAIEGEAAFIRAGTDDFQELAAGVELVEGDSVSTAKRSTVVLELATGQIIKICRQTDWILQRAAIESGTIFIDEAMKYGQTQFEGEAQDRALRTTVQSPSSTLGIRGTRVAISDQPPFEPQVVSLTGRVDYTDARKRVSLGSKGGGTVRVKQSADSAAETALADSYVDPTLGYARSPSEQQLVQQVLYSGATVQSFRDDFPVVRGGTPLTFQQIERTLPDGLVYAFRWNADINFDLTVSIPERGEVVYPTTGLNRSASGYTPFDHQGGPKGGYELVVFPSGFPGFDSDKTGKTFAYFREARFVPNGKTSDYELRQYLDGTLERNIVGVVGPNQFSERDVPVARAAQASSSRRETPPKLAAAGPAGPRGKKR
jgi:hypothetical protein